MYDETLVNRAQNKEFLKGILKKADDHGITGYEFFYGINQSRQYSVTTSLMPLEYIKPSEIIKTSSVFLSFAEGDAVQLNDGKIMTVKDIAYEEKPERALFGLDTKTALLITLEGGLK
jgi:hypothetical protein